MVTVNGWFLLAMTAGSVAALILFIKWRELRRQLENVREVMWDDAQALRFGAGLLAIYSRAIGLWLSRLGVCISLSTLKTSRYGWGASQR